MALKAVLTTEEHGGLEEAIQAHYTATADGKYVLDANVDDHPAVTGLKNTLERYRKVAPDAKALGAKLQEAERLREGFADLDPDEVRTQLEEYEELKKKGGDAVDVQKAVKDAIAATEKRMAPKITEMEGAVAERDSFIHRLVVDQQLDAAMSEHKILDVYRPAVRALLKELGPKVVHDGKDYVGVFATELGDVSIGDYVAKWVREKEAKAYLPHSGNEGSGSTGGGGGGNAGRSNPWKSDTWNLTEQGEIVKENPALAKQLAAAAGRKLQTA